MNKTQKKMNRQEPKTENETHTPQTGRRWDDVEQFAKIISLVAIPVIIAILGWSIQDTLAKRSVSQQYVQMAISILTKADSDVDPVIRDWAVDLLNDNAPTKLSPDTIEQLKTGEISLPQTLAPLLNQGGALAISPDGKQILTGEQDGTVNLWELLTGKQIAKYQVHDDYVTSVAFSPDGKFFASGSGDQTVSIWDINTSKQTAKIPTQDVVIGVAFTPDGKFLLVRTKDGTVSTWDVYTGTEINRINIK